MTAKIIRLHELTKNCYFISKKLTNLGINEDYKGLYFLIDILDEIINNQKIVRSFSRELYPVVAKNLCVNACTIERDIRHIINVLWDYKLKNKLGYLWCKVKKPSCQEFIYLIKNYVIEDII